MARKRVLHWSPGESPDGAAFARAVRENPPDAIEIDLSSRPGLARQMVEWLRGRKSSREIPISFVNGVLPEKKAGPPRTTAQKLGIKDGVLPGVVNAPRDYAALIGSDAEEDPEKPRSVTVWFVHSEETLYQALPRMRALAVRTKLWIAWPKEPDFSSKNLRMAAIDAGLVDYKICSLGPRWSAIAYARRKS